MDSHPAAVATPNLQISPASSLPQSLNIIKSIPGGEEQQPDTKTSETNLKELSIVLSDNSAHGIETPASALLNKKRHLKITVDRNGDESDTFLKKYNSGKLNWGSLLALAFYV